MLLPLASLGGSTGGGSLPGIFNPLAYGALGDGSYDDGPAIRSMYAAIASAGGGYVWCPPGKTFVLGQDGANAWCAEVPSNTIHVGVRGASWFKMKAGMGSSSVKLLRANHKANLTFKGLGFDGNWGATLGVTDSQDGINHATQEDPKNHLLMFQGCEDVLVEDCLFRQAYGDFIWVGYSQIDTTRWSKRVRFRHCFGEMSARSGIALGQAVDGVSLSHVQFRTIYAQALDSEPVDQPTRNVTVEDCYLGGWWNQANPLREVNSPLSIAGGSTLMPAEHSLARNWRVRDTTIAGCVAIQTAKDVVFERCRVLCDWAGYSRPPILVQGYVDDLWILDSFVYDRTTSILPLTHQAAVEINSYGAGNTIIQPVGVHVRGNRVKARNGRHGILVSGSGGRAHNGGGGTIKSLADDSGTASAITSTTLTDSTKSWATDQWQGWEVRVGTVHGVVLSNTATVLTLFQQAVAAATWMTPDGEGAATPSPGAYKIIGRSGVVVVDENDVDCSDDGRGQGGRGIWVYAERYGMRVAVTKNRVKNANGDAIVLEGVDADRAIKHLEVADNKAFDDQPTPTCTNAVRFILPQHITKLILRNNQAGDGVANAVSGLTSGVWLVEDGVVQRWAGYGAPAFAAPKGSIYTRVDGVAGTLEYVNQNGSTTWGAFA